MFRNETSTTEARLVKKDQRIVSYKESTYLCSLTSISGSLAEGPERLALGFFLADDPIVPQVPSTKGFVYLLNPVYKSTKLSLPLRSALVSTALASFAHEHRSLQLFTISRIAYRNACIQVQNATYDDSASRSNDTLMAVMFLSLYEGMVSGFNSVCRWGLHIEGAEALIRHRGNEILSTDVGAGLYMRILGPIMMKDVFECRPTEPFIDWTDLFSIQLPSEQADYPPDRFVAMTQRLPAIRFASMIWLKEPVMSGQVRLNVVKLKNAAKQLDQMASSWPNMARSEWAVEDLGPAPADMQGEIESWKFWPGRLYRFMDKWVTFFWCWGCTNSLFCNYIILNCCERMYPASELEAEPDYITAKRNIQDILDRFCASLPYFLEDIDPIQYPRTCNFTNCSKAGGSPHDSTASNPPYVEGYANSRATHVLTGYFMGVTLFVAIVANIVPLAQRRYLHSRMRALTVKYGVGLVSIYAALGIDGTKDRVMTGCDTNPPPFTFRPTEEEILQAEIEEMERGGRRGLPDDFNGDYNNRAKWYDDMAPVFPGEDQPILTWLNDFENMKI